MKSCLATIAAFAVQMSMFAACLMPVAAHARECDPGLKRLEGTWEPIALYANGDQFLIDKIPASVMHPIQVSVAGNQLTFYMSNCTFITYAITVDSSKSPKQMDIRGGQNLTPAVYSLSGQCGVGPDSLLTICFDKSPNAARPNAVPNIVDGGERPAKNMTVITLQRMREASSPDDEAGPAQRATTQPAAPAAASDGPKETAKAFLDAAEAGNPAAMHKAGVGTYEQFAAVSGLVSAEAAVKRFDAITAKKFGPGGLFAFHRLADIDALTEKIEGDKVVLTGDAKNGLKIGPFYLDQLSLKKVDGAWRVELDSILSKEEALSPETSRLVKEYRRKAHAIDLISEAVMAGKYKTAEDAFTDVLAIYC